MYPKMVFKTPGDQVLPGGKSYGFKAVHSNEEMGAALTTGWFPTVPEAIAGKLDEPVTQGPVEVEPNEPVEPVEVEPNEPVEPVEVEVPPTREELEAKASELGIRFGKRTTDEQLGEAIAAKLAE